VVFNQSHAWTIAPDKAPFPETGQPTTDGIFADHTSYFASASGRTWNFTILDLEPLPPS
jgi:hypothetical protein